MGEITESMLNELEVVTSEYAYDSYSSQSVYSGCGGSGCTNQCQISCSGSCKNACQGSCYTTPR